nr:zinc finger, CCHC-type [Tanacetum cinerariifolium]
MNKQNSKAPGGRGRGWNELNESVMGRVWFGDGSAVEIKGKGTFVLKVQRSSNRLYKMALKVAKPACLAASLVDDAWTWHARLGHANFYTLEMMGKKRMVTRMPCVAHPKQLCNEMGRAKLRMELIKKEKMRITTYHKRKLGILKKASEFSILCDVDTIMIITPPNSSEPE